MAQYVFIFSLGPVQSFIAEARRTQDLYAGSYMLAQLARAAAQAAGGKLVYPAPDVLTNPEAGVPNKFVTIVDDPKDAAQNAQRSAEERWHSFAREALAKLPNNNDDELLQIWERQRDHHLEFYWAAAPLDDDYIRAYERAFEALDARKRTRNFEQVKEDGLKDSLSGRRSALWPSRDKNARAYWSRVLDAQRTRANLKEGERLDTIGVMKRFALDKKFPSISTVASAPFTRACRDAGLLKKLVQAIEAFNKEAGYEFFYRVGDFEYGFEYDGDLLYWETYARIRLKASYGEPHRNPTEVLDVLEQVYRRAKEHRIHPTPPTPYYAILAMDGDRMGKHISACRSKEEHARLSQQLAEFAAEVERIIQKYGGYLVYAGGDDVLAFFPLKSALAGANALAQRYREKFKDWEQFEPDGTSLPFTASAGIAIAHHLHPLDAVLETARRAERAAKNRYNRDAVCVSVLKRSGEPIRLGSKWEADGADIVNLVQNIVGDLGAERLASRFVYELSEQVTALETVEAAMLALLLKRLLKRHGDENKPPKTTVEDLMAWVRAFEQDGMDVPGGAAAELGRWLLLARFIEQGGGE